MEPEACCMCTKQVLEFVKKAQIRPTSIQFPCCKRHHFYDGPIGTTYHGSQIKRVSQGKGIPKEDVHAPVTRVAGMKTINSVERKNMKKILDKCHLYHLWTLGLSSMGVTGAVPRLCEIASTLHHTCKQCKKRWSGNLSVLPREGACVCSTFRLGHDTIQSRKGLVAATGWQG